MVLKVVELESYDDTLENVSLKRNAGFGELFESNAALREDYTLRYMLNLEAEGSLLNLECFRNPWHYTIKIRRDGVVQDAPVDLVETFNYLIGLRVKRYDTYGQEGLLFVIGTDPEGRRVIIVWRDCDLWPNDRLEEKCRQAFESFRPDEFDLVYVNGDNHLPIIKTGEESWKVSLIEETFHARMFDTSDVE
jgi:adenine-specific DNA-methyltransferase